MSNITTQKALLEKIKLTGKGTEDVPKMLEDITKLQELLKEIHEKSRKDDLTFEYPKREF